MAIKVQFQLLLPLQINFKVISTLESIFILILPKFLSTLFPLSSMGLLSFMPISCIKVQSTNRFSHSHSLYLFLIIKFSPSIMSFLLSILSIYPKTTFILLNYCGIIFNIKNWLFSSLDVDFPLSDI